MDQRTMVILIV